MINCVVTQLKLTTLDISANRIKHLPDLSFLTDLTDLWASSNQLSDLHSVSTSLKNNAELKCLYLEHNPLQTTQRATYREDVARALPQLSQIDARPLTRA